MRGFHKPRKRNMRPGQQRKLKFQARYTQSSILLLVCGLSCYFWAPKLNKNSDFSEFFSTGMHWCTHTLTHTHIFLGSKVKPEENRDFLHTSLHGYVNRNVEGEKDVVKSGPGWKWFRKWGRAQHLWGINQLKSIALRVRPSIVKMTAH